MEGSAVTMNTIRVTLAALLAASPVVAQTTDDPFPAPIAATEGAIAVNFVEFASIPDLKSEPARRFRQTQQHSGRYVRGHGAVDHAGAQHVQREVPGTGPDLEGPGIVTRRLTQGLGADPCQEWFQYHVAWSNRIQIENELTL